MKLIDNESEEEIIAIVKEPSALTEEIENLVWSYTGKASITGFNDEVIPQRHIQIETAMTRLGFIGGYQVFKRNVYEEI